MNIRKLVASGILGATSLLTGCDAYNNTQKAFSRAFIEDSSAKKEQEAFNKQLDEQRRQIEQKKNRSSLDHLIQETDAQQRAAGKYEETKDAYNGFVAEHPEAEPLAVFPQFNKPVYAKHDVLIREAVNKWNAYFSTRVAGYQSLHPNFVKALMLTEAGSARDVDSWTYDPMSLAHAGDVGFEALVKKDQAHLVDGDAYLGTLQRTPRKNGKWDYTFTPAEGKHKITAEESIDEGIHLLCQKALKFTIVDAKGTLEVSFRGWDEGAERYNGGGDKQYINKIHEKMRSINTELK